MPRIGREVTRLELLMKAKVAESRDTYPTRRGDARGRLGTMVELS